VNNLKWVFIAFNLIENLCDKPGLCKVIKQRSSIAGRVELCWNNYSLKGERSSQQTAPTVSEGPYSAGGMSCCFTERRDSCRKFVMVNGTMLRRTATCQSGPLSLFFVVCSTVEFLL